MRVINRQHWLHVLGDVAGPRPSVHAHEHTCTAVSLVDDEQLAMTSQTGARAVSVVNLLTTIANIVIAAF